MAAPAIKLGQRNTLKTGPASGVFTTTDPFDGGINKWKDSRNIYIPAPDEESDTYARPGFVPLNNGNAVYTSATPFKGQGAWTHFELDGTPINFIVMGGHLFREDPALGTTTDVTPVGVTIDGSTATRVFAADMNGIMVVSDGVNRPWIGSNLNATPITGTYIDFDGSGTAWAAFGPPQVFGGSGFFVLKSYNGTSYRIDIAWSEPADWTTGYQQTDFDNRWTLEQTGTSPIYALIPTEVALFYTRQRSIGSIQGVVGPNLAANATHDVVSQNVGCESPQTIVQFGNTIFFCDVIGRPYMFPIGSPPNPIWHQLRGVVDTSPTAYPAVTAIVSTAVLEPTLNLYCVAIWSDSPAGEASPTQFFAFDALTGRYMGPWSIGSAVPGVSIDALGAFIDNDGRGQLIALGSLTPGGTTGYAWAMNSLIGVPDFIVLEDGATFLTDESTPGVDIIAEGQGAIWQDNGAVPVINVTTDRLGYSEDIVWLYDQATILTGSQAPLSITATTPNAASVLEGTPTPNASADGINRTQMGLDLQGRGLQLTISPTTADSQWSIARVSVVGVPNPAQPDDQ